MGRGCMRKSEQDTYSTPTLEVYTWSNVTALYMQLNTRSALQKPSLRSPELKSVRIRSTGNAEGGFPDRRNRSVAPRPYMSEAGVAAPLNCSGDM